MLNLEPLIARLVDDVLRAIRNATLAELRAVLESTEHDLGRKALAVPLRPPPRSRRVPATKVTRLAAPAARTETRSHPEPEPHSEITDPERLLAPPTAAPVPPSGSADAPAEEPTEAERVEPQEEVPNPPAPAAAAVVVHAAGNAPARLRVGESLANTTGTGVVIRRAKKT